MAATARGVKASAGGGTAFVTATTILPGEVNTDFDNIYNEFNGNIDNANVKAAAGIELSKIDGYSDSTTENVTETNPGTLDTAASLPSDAQGELVRIRYKLKELGTGTATKRLDGTAATDLVSWFETPMTGPNLIRNGNFAVKTTAAGSAPDGWALVGTPGTCTTTTTGVTEGHSTARALTVAAAGAALEGISQTLVGLKANTKYVVGCRAKVNAGGDIVRLLTTGAVAGVFDDLALDTSNTTYTTLAGVIKTDNTPTDIVVQLLAVADGDSFDVTHVWVRECSTDILPFSDTAHAYNEITGNTAGHYASGVMTDSGLTANVVCPGPGYVIEVNAKLDVRATGVDTGIAMSLRENGTEVDTAYLFLAGNVARDKGSIQFNWVKTNPTPGTTYTYTVFGAGLGDTVDRNGAALIAETPRSWIRVRAYLESGGR